MAAITKKFGAGGANLAPEGAAGDPDLATALRDVADDLASIRTAVNSNLGGLAIAAADPAEITAGAQGAFTDPPSAGEMSSLRTLVNELRTTASANRVLLLELKNDINSFKPGTISASDPPEIAAVALAAFTDPPTAGEMALLRTLVNEIRTTEIANRVLALELKTDVNAASAAAVGTLLTSKA